MSLDFLLTNGDLDFRTEFADTRVSVPLVAQHISAVLNIAIGEWPVDATQGFPWIEFGLNSHTLSPSMFRSAVAEALEAVPEIVVLSIVATKRDLRMECIIEARVAGRRFRGQLFSTNPMQRDSGGNELFAMFVPAIDAS